DARAGAKRAPGEAISYANLAMAQACLGRYDDAIATCNAGIATHRLSDRLHWLRASIHHKKGEVERAQADQRTLSGLTGPFVKLPLRLFVDPPKPAPPKPLRDEQRKEVARLLAQAEEAGARSDFSRADKLAAAILQIDPAHPGA